MKKYFSLFAISSMLIITSLACEESAKVSTPTDIGALTVEQAVAATMAAMNPAEVISPTEVPTQEPPQEPTTAPLGSARSNPAPVGSTVKADDMEFSVVSVVRPANQQVADGNMFNATPEPNKEYILVEIKADCTKTSDEKCNLSTFNFKALNSSGVMSDMSFLVGISGELESKEFFGGASVSGFLPFLVDQSDPTMLVYSPLFDINNSEFYLSLQ